MSQSQSHSLKERETLKKRVRLSFINFISYFHSFHFSFQWEIERESERKRERNTLREEASSIEHRSSRGAKQSAIYNEGRATMTSDPATMCSGLDRFPTMCEWSPMSDDVLWSLDCDWTDLTSKGRVERHCSAFRFALALVISDVLIYWFKVSDLVIVGGKKVSFPINEIYVGLKGLNRNSTMGLMHDPKAIGEDPRNLLYFMPWA